MDLTRPRVWGWSFSILGLMLFVYTAFPMAQEHELNLILHAGVLELAAISMFVAEVAQSLQR